MIDTPQTANAAQITRDDHDGPGGVGPILDDPLLGVLADIVDDFEKIRVANENRLRILTTAPDVVDADGISRGHGLTLQNPEVARVAASIAAIKDAEHQSILNLQRSVRKHPLGPWAKQQPGVGEKQFARLLAVIGDPYWNDLHDRPRTLRELRAYCGFHVLHPDAQSIVGSHSRSGVGVAPKRQRGHKSNWNEDARKRAWLIATSCLKQPDGTRYRDIYTAARAKYADAVHGGDCVRCGPAGKPAPAGTPLSLGHQHARGLRAVAQAFLAELWRESKRIHEAHTEEAAA